MAKRGEETEDTEQSVADADERAIQEVKDKAERVRERPEPEPDDEPPLEFAEDRPSADDDDDEPARPGRDEKKRLRWKELEERAERAERAAQAATTLLQQQQRQQPAQQQAPRDEGVSQYDNAYRDNQREQVWLSQQYESRLSALRAAGQGISAEENQQYLDRAAQLQLQAAEIATLRAANLHGYRPQPAQMDPYAAVLNSKYADVTTDPEAKAYAAYLYRAGLKRGEVDGPILLEKVLEETRAHMRGSQPARQRRPTADSRARYTGSAAGAGGSRGGDSDGGNQSGKRTLPPGLSLKEFERMADQMFPHIKDDKKRYTHYYRECVEPKLAEK